MNFDCGEYVSENALHRHSSTLVLVGRVPTNTRWSLFASCTTRLPSRANRGFPIGSARRFHRGTLYHRYEIDEQGLISSAVIVPPTAQNQAAIEADLAGISSHGLGVPEAVELGRALDRLPELLDAVLTDLEREGG